MRFIRMSRSALAVGCYAGLGAALIDWAGFLARGGAGGAPHTGTFYSLGLFMAEFILFGLAGYLLRRQGKSTRESVLGGLVAGVVCGLLAEFPRTTILFSDPRYMRWIQHTRAIFRPGQLFTPWLSFGVLAALAGAVLAGIALGAACGAIGSSFFGPVGGEQD